METAAAHEGSYSPNADPQCYCAPLWFTQHVATHEVRLNGEQPVLLHGGGLLGVVLNKPHSSGTGE